MNLHRPNANEALQTKNRSRDVAPQSGICSRCLDGCKGNCDMFRATFRGRELLYPEPFGSVTAGADKDYPVDYSHLNIMGYALGAKGVEADPDKATFPNVDTETSYGVTDKGENESADIHRGARQHGYCAQKLEAFCRRRRHQRHQPGLR